MTGNIENTFHWVLGIQVWQEDRVKLASWFKAVGFLPFRHA